MLAGDSSHTVVVPTAMVERPARPRRRNRDGEGDGAWDAVPRVEATPNKRHAFTADEVAKLHKAAQGFDAESRWPTFWPAAVALSWYTGLRIGDIATLDWSEIDLDAGLLTVIPEKSWRRGRPVVHPIAAEVLPVLAATTDREGYVWPELAHAYENGGKRVFMEFNSVAWRKPCRMRGKDIGFHGIRRGHVTQLRDLGVALDDIRDTVGHADSATTDGYSESVAAGRRVAEVMPVLVTND